MHRDNYNPASSTSANNNPVRAFFMNVCLAFMAGILLSTLIDLSAILVVSAIGIAIGIVVVMVNRVYPQTVTTICGSIEDLRFRVTECLYRIVIRLGRISGIEIVMALFIGFLSAAYIFVYVTAWTELFGNVGAWGMWVGTITALATLLVLNVKFVMASVNDRLRSVSWGVLQWQTHACCNLIGYMVIPLVLMLLNMAIGYLFFGGWVGLFAFIGLGYIQLVFVMKIVWRD